MRPGIENTWIARVPDDFDRLNPDDDQRVWVAKAGTTYRGIATYDRMFDVFIVGENDVTKDVTHWAPCNPPEGP